MTASAEPRAPLADLRAAQDVEYISPSNPRAQPLLFKKRKLLPHPRPDSFPYRKGLHVGLSGGAPLTVAPYHDATTAAPRTSRSQSPRPRPTLHQPSQRPKRVGTGPDMPPTPPAQSRTSSSSHSAVPSSPAESPDASTGQVQAASAPSPPRTPTTPTKQRSPPTPDVTPPQLRVSKRPGPVPVTRPVGGDRILSRSTTASGADSFMTARETMSAPEEEDGKAAARPKTPSVKTSSQSTLRRASRADADETIKVNGGEEIKPKKKKKPKTIGLGLGLESSPESDATATPPRRRDRFVSFDGEWSPGENEVEKQWDDNLERNVTVRKQLPVMNGHTPEILEDNTVLPTSATEALRSMSLPERALAFPSPLESHVQIPSARAVFPLQHSPEIAARRLSTMSSYSTTSTVLDGTPRRQRTLRHVRKVDLLRDSRSELSQSSSATVASVQLEEVSKRRPPLTDMRLSEARHASYVSTSTTNSISSRKARRDVCKNGGIPVVVVPERRSSLKSESRTPSLRSTRSSRRSQSVGSAPLLSQLPKGKDLAPYFDRPSRRGRAMSESDGSQPGDQRTMDYPPIVPRRTSSLSAPTSRNTSRAGSLTAENLRDLQALQAQTQTQTQTQPPSQKPHEPRRNVPTSQPTDQADPPAKAQATPAPRKVEPTDAPISAGPEVRIEPAPSVESVDEATRMHPMHRVSVDHHGDPLFGRRLSAQHTPFSQHSVDTNATSHAEVSEAMAVNIYPHQNTSVLMVNHSNKPSLSSSSTSSTAKEMQPQEFLAFDDAPEPPAKPAPATTGKPIIKMVDMDAAAVPATPPQPIFSMDDVDSPLRNPRAPPEPPSRLQPPVIEFIPATPSGLTPAQEKQAQLGNFYEALVERPPARRMSLVRRALSLRQSPSHGPTPPRSSSSGFISRALSLSRGSSLRRDHSRQRAASSGRDKPSSKAMGPDDEPADETRLHPFWRPAYAPESDSESDSDGGADLHDRTYRYPPIDNRPRPPRRSLSQRMKHTFAILPIRDDYDRQDGFPAGGPPDSPIRRTVRRTPSGNLRVVGRRGSHDSVRRARNARQEQHHRHHHHQQQQATRSGTRPSTAPDGESGQLARRRRNAEPVGGGDGTPPTRRRSLLLFGGTSSGGLAGRLDGYSLQDLPRRLSERRREKRSRELRQKISLPREVRDGVHDVVRRNNYRDACTQAQPQIQEAVSQPSGRYTQYHDGR